jgi:hypothetical protein
MAALVGQVVVVVVVPQNQLERSSAELVAMAVFLFITKIGENYA